MCSRTWYACVFAGLLLASPLFAQAKPSPIQLPEGTKVYTIKYGDNETVANLKPAEEVAFVLVYGLVGLEERCLDKDMGIGRLAPLRDLVRGVKTPGGEIIGLTVDPAKDTNYRYDMMIIGTDCAIWAVPKVSGLAAFAMIGPARFGRATFYYNPKGADLTKAEKLTEMGFEGNGFAK